MIATHRYRIRVLLVQKKELDKLVKDRTKLINKQKLELKERNEHLVQAEEEVKATNDQLRQVNDNLELTVAKRTEKIKLKNEKIRKFAFLNSHRVRAPLTRILGLINVYQTCDLKKEDIDHVNDSIQKSAIELDEITRKINDELGDD